MKATIENTWIVIGIIVVIALAMLVYYLLFHNLKVEAGIAKMKAKYDAVDFAGVVCILVAAFGMLALSLILLIRWLVRTL